MRNKRLVCSTEGSVWYRRDFRPWSHETWSGTIRIITLVIRPSNYCVIERFLGHII